MTGVTPVRTLSEVRTARNSLLGLDWILKSGRIKSVEENIVQDHLAEIQSQPEKPWLKIALFSVLGLVLVGGLIFAAVKVGVPSKPQPKACSTEAKICPDGSAVGRTGPNCEFAPCPNQVTQDETADWKTYRSENYGFEIMYPPDWEAKQEFSYQDGFFIANSQSKSRVAILPNGEFGYGLPGSQPEISNIIFAGRRAEQTLFKNLKIKWIRILTPPSSWSNDNRVDVNFSTQEEIIDQILSTFKFLDQSQTDETANWKTYTSTKYGITFKYPQNFMATEGRGQYFINQKPLIELESETLNLLTNQVEALFTVTVKSNAKSDCEYVPRGNLDTLQDRVVNGVKFSLFSNIGVAAGSKYSSTIYHYLDDTTCYEIVTTIREGSDGNSPEGISKVEEQKNMLNAQLGQILSTFKFLDRNTPEAVTEDFYNWYFTCLQNHFKNPAEKSPQEDCPYSSQKSISQNLVQTLASRVGYDPVFCAQELPSLITIDKATLSNEMAEVVVHTYYEVSGDNSITVNLTLVEDTWKISNITCQKR